MPDLNIETAWTCGSNVAWAREYRSEPGKRAYMIRWERLPPPLAERHGCEYGWTCTCPSYNYRGIECKHIDAVRSERCGWNEELEPTLQAKADPSKRATLKVCCPKCDGPVVAVRVST